MVLHGQLGHHPIIPALPSCPYGIAGQHHEDDRFKDSAASNPLTSDQSRGVQWMICRDVWQLFNWVWINTYIHTIFIGMNIHLPQLFWCELQGYKVLTHCQLMNLDIFGPWNCICTTNLIGIDWCQENKAPKSSVLAARVFPWGRCPCFWWPFARRARRLGKGSAAIPQWHFSLVSTLQIDHLLYI